MHRRAGLIFSALLPAVLVTSEPARAQTVSNSGQLYPHRIVGAADLGSSTRPQNLMPLGINYNDCTANMTLQFNLSVSGFDGSESLQIWASKSGDCTTSTARGVGANAVTTCWIVGQGFTAQIINSVTVLTFNVRVQDLVGLQNAPPSPPNYVPQGGDACTTAQTTFVAVPLNIYFLPLDTSLNVKGTPYMYSITTDLVGPPAPVGVSKMVGDTLFFLNWSPNTDADTNGYDVFMDPIPGQEDAAAPQVDSSISTVLVCPDSNASSAQQDAETEADTEAGDDGSALDATPSSSSDAGCYYENVGGSSTGSPGSSSCTSVALGSAIVQDSGVVVQQTDDAGNPIEGGLVSGNGGISTIPQPYLVATGSVGVTVSDKNTGTYTIKGLRNGTTYNAVVAAVDGSGNVGPPSVEVCDYPAPVNDFWNIYRQAGGQAGGGCALERAGEPASAAMGVALAGLTSVLARRRRRSRRETSFR